MINIADENHRLAPPRPFGPVLESPRRKRNSHLPQLPPPPHKKPQMPGIAKASPSRKTPSTTRLTRARPVIY
ncbi:hypothetical protein M426DRAFT_320524 [Hypoxylon sp. CI-4A]|nr:hypothetical protein M426DRAFT_320524 [Hypoxylon sp. CI-4A]